MEYRGAPSKCLQVCDVILALRLGNDRACFRQAGYVPFGVLDVSSTGRQTREGSRTLEVMYHPTAGRKLN